MTQGSRHRVLPTPAELDALIRGGADVTILAVQSVNPYTGRISVRDRRVPGAIDTQAYEDFQSPGSPERGQRPLPDIAELQDKARRWGLRRESTVVVYDDDRSMTAARAWWVLRWAGLPDVRVLDGGLWAWEKAGFATASAPPVPAPSDIVLTPGNMPEFGPDDAARFADQGVLIDARIRVNYIGGTTAAGQPRRGHIPGAVSAPAPDNVTDYGTFIEAFALRELYASLGVDGRRPVGVYCGAGMSAAHTVLALASLGVDAAMYPGSWSAWVHDPRHPAVIGAAPR